MQELKVGLIQMQVSDSKEVNLKKAEEMVNKAASKGVKMAVLPEMFNCPYNTEHFPTYAEKERSYSWQTLARIARENNIYLVGGSIPELGEDNRIFNTSYVFDPHGNQIAKHRKMHLFDIDIKNGQYFKESDMLSAGDAVTVFETSFGKIGLMICYDIRFPELSRLMVQKGAEIIIVPGAFNMTTGPAHWEILFRARALDNQVYALGAAPARNTTASYVSYGNSIVTDPWGQVSGRLSEEEDILISNLDLELIKKLRTELPLLQHIRKDLYQLKES